MPMTTEERAALISRLQERLKSPKLSPGNRAVFELDLDRLIKIQEYYLRQAKT